jgi:uncharacterized protein YrrD
LDDFQFSLEDGKIFGYRLRAPGVFAKTGGVAASEVIRIGKDLMLIKEAACISWTGDKRNLEEGRAWGSRYLKMRVMTRRGTGMGHIEDFYLEHTPENTGTILGLLLDGERMVRLDEGKVTLAKDVVILEEAGAAVPLEGEPENTDWWSRITQPK